MILTTAATGRVGSAVSRELAQRGIDHITTSRTRPTDPTAATAWQAGDLADAATFKDLLPQVTSVFLFPVFTGVSDLVELAARSGVRRIVMLSSDAITDPVQNPIGDIHAGLEAQVRASGIPAIFVRPTVFMANDLAWAPLIAPGNSVPLVHPDAATRPVSERDIATTIVNALLGHIDETTSTVYGPELLTQTQRLEIIAEEIGRRVSWHEIDETEAARDLATQGMPEPAAAYLIDSRRRAAEGSGHQPGSDPIADAEPYRTWVQRHRQHFG